MNVLRAVMMMRRDLEEDIAAVEVLRQTPLDRIEEAVKRLRKQRTVAEVRKAMVDRIARAPLSEFETLKTIYLRYCGDERE